jgi:cytochrome c-type biogenesis protein CcmH/NrfG
MVKKEKVESEYIKKDTLLIVTFIALIVGFLGGIVFSVYKFRTKESVQTAMFQEQTSIDKDVSTDRAVKILELEQKTSQSPDDVAAWVQLGNLYFDSNNYTKAILAYNKSLELNPGNANVMTDLGVMYRRNSQPPEAIKAFDKAIKIDPKHETARFNKGIVLMHDLNDLAGAILAWEELVKVNPLAKGPNGRSVKELLDKLKER